LADAAFALDISPKSSLHNMHWTAPYIDLVLTVI